MLAPMLTAFLSRSDVSRHTQALHLIRELGEALGAGAAGTSATLRFSAPAPDGATLLGPATHPGIPAYAVSVSAERSLAPAVARTVLQLHELSTGKLLALMDTGHLMALRSSLVSALAADLLARPDACRVAILGSGAAASGALKALRLVRSLERVWLFEADLSRSFELAQHLQTSLSMAVRAADSADEAVAEADIIVLTGGVRLPADTARPGAHLTVLDAGRFAECPVPRATLERARRLGDRPVSELAWGAPFHASLGSVLRHEAPGRTSPDELTLFAAEGLASLDLVAAWHVYQGAREDEALTRLDLEA